MIFRGETYSYERLVMHNKNILENALANNELDLFDKSIIKSVYSPNPDIEPGGKYYDALETILLDNEIDKDAIFSLGVDIGSDICEETSSTRTRIVKFLNITRAANDLRFELLGKDTHYGQVIGLSTAMRTILASNLPSSPSVRSVFLAIGETFEKATMSARNDIESRSYKEADTRLAFLSAKYDTFQKVKSIADKYNDDFPDDETYASLRSQATLLTNEAMRHRKYGTKPAYIDASVGGAWIFYDGDDLIHKMGGRKVAQNYADVAAVVCYSPYDEFKTLRFDFDTSNPQISSLTGPIAEKLSFMIFIGKDGSISTDPSGVEDLGLELGLSHSQEIALRAEVASNFYDLSMPLMRHRSNDEKTFENLVDRKKPNFNPIRDLLIPRMHYIEQAEDFPASEDVSRTVREHDVTWFVRTLPSGWHPSPEAVAQAEYHGIELAENETFVKAHTRGRGSKVLGYHVVKRTQQS